MSMTMAVAYHNLVLLATDTRCSLTMMDGSVRHVDGQGKMHRLNNGWMTGTGEATLVEQVFGAIDPGADEPEEVGGCIASVRQGLDPRIERVDPTYFFLGVGGARPRIVAFDGRGQVVSDADANIMFSLPPGAEDLRPALNDALRTQLGTVRDLGDLVRLVAASFAAARAKSDHVGPDMVLTLDGEGVHIDRHQASLKALMADPRGELRAATQAPVAARFAAGAISTIHIESLEATPTRGLRLNSAYPIPGTWTHFIDLAATGSDPVIQLPGLTILANGDAVFDGEVASESFTGANCDFGGTITMSDTAPILSAPNGPLVIEGGANVSVLTTGGTLTLGNSAQPLTLSAPAAGVNFGNASSTTSRTAQSRWLPIQVAGVQYYLRLWA